jgi:ABC-type transport system substrate-binding protein
MLFYMLSILVILSFLASCSTPTPETITTEKEVTRVVTEKEIVKETEIVVETQIVKETEIVELVFGNLPRNETLIIAGTASNDVWDTFSMMAGSLTNAYSGYQQVAIEQAFLFAGGEYYPYLAQKWEYNADGTGMTIFLNTDAAWNDGTPVTIDDWTFTLDYLHENKDKGVPWGTLLDSASYTTEGTDKIIFSFFEEDSPETPRVNWRFHQGFASFVPLAKHIWEGQDPVTFKNNPPVEAGPYKLVNCNADTKTCIWERRDDYWKKDEKLSPKYIVFTRQPAPDLLTQEMINGSFDISQLNPKIAMTVAMAQNPDLSMIEWPDPCPATCGSMFNARRWMTHSSGAP